MHAHCSKKAHALLQNLAHFCNSTRTCPKSAGTFTKARALFPKVRAHLQKLAHIYKSSRTFTKAHALLQKLTYFCKCSRTLGLLKLIARHREHSVPYGSKDQVYMQVSSFCTQLSRNCTGLLKVVCTFRLLACKLKKLHGTFESSMKLSTFCT